MTINWIPVAIPLNPQIRRQGTSIAELRSLILIGVGIFMLALAAYNLGPTRIRRTIRKVEDPIRQRNFWYLYRVRALPAETRDYVPKIFAAVIICRNPEQLGFQTRSSAPAS